MNSELERLRALAAVIATAEAALDTAYRTLQASAAAPEMPLWPKSAPPPD
jgi:hypothetical protein